MVHDVVFIASLVTLGIGVAGVVMGFLAGYFKGGEPDYGGPICGAGFIMILIALVGFLTDARMQLRAWRGGLFRQGEWDIREVMITLGVAMFAMTLVWVVIEGVVYYRWFSGSITEFIARRSLQPLILLMVIGLVVTATGLMMPINYSESEVPARLPVPPERLCATCNRPMTWNPQHKRWFANTVRGMPESLPQGLRIVHPIRSGYKLVEAVRVKVGVSRDAKRCVMHRLKEGLFGG